MKGKETSSGGGGKGNLVEKMVILGGFRGL